MTYNALIPVKTLSEAKSRLAAHLPQCQRSTLVLTMLHHVIRTLRETKALKSITVVSIDPTVLEKAVAWGAHASLEKQRGHNPALHAAALQEIAAGATALLTISVDLPLLEPNDILAMIAQSQLHEAVLAPSRDGTGTNAILVRPPLALPYLFGPGSLQRYLAEAQQRHLSSTLVESTGLALDIDTQQDLAILQRYEAKNKAILACYSS